MNRAAWTIAWRRVRRRMQPGPHDEAALLDDAARQLGRRVTLTEQCVAGEAWQARRYGPAVASFAQARTRRFYALADRCGDRWAREEVDAAAALIVMREVPYAPRDPRRFMPGGSAAAA